MLSINKISSYLTLIIFLSDLKYANPSCSNIFCSSGITGMVSMVILFTAFISLSNVTGFKR